MIHAKLWTDMFVLSLPLTEKIIRPVLVYCILILGLRLSGKRELAQLNPFDLVVLLTLSNTVQNAIIGDDNSVTGGVVGATTLLAVNYVVVRFLSEHENLDRLVEGAATVLIANGKIDQEALRRELMTIPELEVAAHKQGFASLDDVDRATLEPGGVLSFVAQKPTVESMRHAEMMARLDEIMRRLATLQPQAS